MVSSCSSFRSLPMRMICEMIMRAKPVRRYMLLHSLTKMMLWSARWILAMKYCVMM